MFKNILIGQYVDTGSVLHRLDARIKIIMILTAAVMIFAAYRPMAVLYILVLCVMLVFLSGMRLGMILRGIKPVLFLAVFTLVCDSFLTEGETLFTIGKLTVTHEGLYDGVIAALRLILLVSTASVLTMTTKPLDLTDAIESLLKPLGIFRLPVRDIAVMMGISIRFIPTLGEEAQRIADAQRSRCADFDGGGIIKKAKAALPLVVPLLIGAFRHSDALAQAMDARCYGMGKRTRLHEKKLCGRDGAAIALTAAAVILQVGVTLI